MRTAPDIHFAVIDRRAVVLDLARDRYFGLSPAFTERLLRSVGPHPDAASAQADDPILARLVGQGLLAPGDPPLTRTALAAKDALWPGAGLATLHQPLGLRTALSVILILARVALSLRRRSFRDTIAGIEKTPVRRGVRRPPSPQQLLDAYQAARPFFPLKPICRLDAMALTLFFRSRGLEAELVFGARLDPFEAHCWVQQGQTVLQEPHDRIAQYTPILTV